MKKSFLSFIVFLCIVTQFTLTSYAVADAPSNSNSPSASFEEWNKTKSTPMMLTFNIKIHEDVTPTRTVPINFGVENSTESSVSLKEEKLAYSVIQNLLYLVEKDGELFLVMDKKVKKAVQAGNTYFVAIGFHPEIEKNTLVLNSMVASGYYSLNSERQKFAEFFYGDIGNGNSFNKIHFDFTNMQYFDHFKTRKQLNEIAPNKIKKHKGSFPSNSEIKKANEKYDNKNNAEEAFNEYFKEGNVFKITSSFTGHSTKERETQPKDNLIKIQKIQKRSVTFLAEDGTAYRIRMKKFYRNTLNVEYSEVPNTVKAHLKEIKVRGFHPFISFGDWISYITFIDIVIIAVILFVIWFFFLIS